MAKTAKKTTKKVNKKAASKKTKASKAKPAKKGLSDAIKKLMKKPKDELTPLEKAHIARALGKGKKAGKKKAKLTFKAPEGMKPVFMRADLAFGKDGNLSGSRLTVIKGRIDSDTAKTVELAKYDPATANAVVARIAGPIYIKSEKKRLPAGLMVQALFRVGRSGKTGAISTGLKSVKAKLPEKKVKELAKKDPMYRAIRKCARPLAGAFTKFKPFPSAKELKALNASEEE